MCTQYWRAEGRKAPVGGAGDVAQLGERRLCKPEVEGSIPFVSIKLRKIDRETTERVWSRRWIENERT
jgi:hypothetical protein